VLVAVLCVKLRRIEIFLPGIFLAFAKDGCCSRTTGEEWAEEGEGLLPCSSLFVDTLRTFVSLVASKSVVVKAGGFCLSNALV